MEQQPAASRGNSAPRPGQHQAVQAVALVESCLSKLPRLTPESIRILANVCNIEMITKKAAESARKTSQDSVAAQAATHAAMKAAEKRALCVLLLLRDVAFQRDGENRRTAVDCLVELAAGRLTSSYVVHDKALKLVMNAIYAKNNILASEVTEAAKVSLEWASKYAVDQYEKVQAANKSERNKALALLPLKPHSDVEKAAMDLLRKPVLLYMALCIRRPAAIEHLFKLSCVERADVLSKTVRANMPKMATAVAIKHGAASIAMDVAAMTSNEEVPMLLAFLEDLVPRPDDELIQACKNIQDLKSKPDQKDPRFIIPVIGSMNCSSASSVA